MTAPSRGCVYHLPDDRHSVRFTTIRLFGKQKRFLLPCEDHSWSLCARAKGACAPFVLESDPEADAARTAADHHAICSASVTRHLTALREQKARLQKARNLPCRRRDEHEAAGNCHCQASTPRTAMPRITVSNALVGVDHSRGIDITSG